jgi:hypothetical protein
MISSNLSEIAKKLGGKVHSGQVLCPGPNHSAIDRSLSVKLDSNAPDGFLVHSFANDDPLACRDYVRSKLGLPPFEPNKVNGMRRERLLPGPPKPATLQEMPEAYYDYCDETGKLLFQVVRYGGEPKRFKQRRPDPEHPGKWLWNLDGIQRVLYRLPEVRAAVAAGTVIYVVEGEKDADALGALGIEATTNSGGAGKWDAAYNESLRGADIVVVPDNDRPGRDHAVSIAASLSGVAKRIRILDLAEHWDCPAKGDISDWINSGGAADQLSALVADLTDWNPHPSRLRPLTLSEFFSLEIKPREMLLDPIIPEKGLAMLYASRGTGKTHIALGIGYAVATGTGFLRWKAPKPRRVLLVDGEMPAAALQERLATSSPE